MYLEIRGGLRNSRLWVKLFTSLPTLFRFLDSFGCKSIKKCSDFFNQRERKQLIDMCRYCL